MLDRIARRYSTDPWDVLQWAPERVALAKVCMDAGEASVRRRLERMAADSRSPMAVIDVGG